MSNRPLCGWSVSRTLATLVALAALVPSAVVPPAARAQVSMAVRLDPPRGDTEAAARPGLAATRPHAAAAVAAQDGSLDLFVPLPYRRYEDSPQLYVQRVSMDGEPRWGARGVWIADSLDAYAMAPDGSGGLFVAWSSPHSASWRGRLHIQHLAADGHGTWGPAGRTVPEPTQRQAVLALVSDRSGGVLVIWSARLESGLDEVRVQRLDASGAPVWLTPTSVPAGVSLGSILRDGQGGLILVRLESAYPLSLIATRIDANGARLWGDPGVVIASNVFPVRSNPAVEDGDGGAYVAWVDVPDGMQAIPRAQHVGSDGTLRWNPTGVVIPDLGLAYDWEWGPTWFGILPDGCGGVLFEQDLPSGTLTAGPHDRMLLQGLDADARVRWPGGGLRVRDSVAQAGALSPNSLCGVDIVWQTLEDSRLVLRAQRLAASGLAQWGPRGVSVSAAPEGDWLTAAGPDGAGGVLLVWEDRRSFEWHRGDRAYDLHAQRLSPDGTPLWTPGGRCILASPFGQRDPSVVPADSGMIVTWAEREGCDVRALARRFERDGTPRGPVIALGGGAGSHRAPRATTDGSGGAFVVWEQSGPETIALRAQHLTADGTLAWGAHGVLVRDAAGICRTPEVLADGDGGAYLAWVENGGSVRVQRLDAEGAPRWAPEGVTVSSGYGSLQIPALAPDGMGGVLVGWLEIRGVLLISTLQRLDPAGVRQWAAGGVANWLIDVISSWIPVRPLFAADGEGGAYVMADRNHVQRLGADGRPRWPEPGMAISASADYWRSVELAYGPSGEAYAVWTDANGPRRDLLAQRLSPDGELFWPATGATVATGVALPTDARVMPDSSGSLLVAWSESHPLVQSSSGSPTVGAQRIRISGLPAWSGGPAVLDAAREPVLHLAAIPDGRGGAFAAWEAERPDGDRRLRLQHLLGDGTVAWGTDGWVPDLAVVVRTRASARLAHLEWRLAGEAGDPRAERRTADGPWTPCGAVSVGDSGLVTLEDATEPGTRYAYRLVVRSGGVESASETTWLETPPLAVRLTGAWPSPARGPFTVAFALAEGAPARLEVFDLSGRRVEARALDGLAPGRHTLTLGDTRPLRPGLYLVSLAQGGHRETRRVVVLR